MKRSIYWGSKNKKPRERLWLPSLLQHMPTSVTQTSYPLTSSKSRKIALINSVAFNIPQARLSLCFSLQNSPLFFPYLYQLSNFLPLFKVHLFSVLFLQDNTLRNKITFILLFPFFWFVFLSCLLHDLLLFSHVDWDQFSCFKNQLRSPFGVDLFLRRTPVFPASMYSCPCATPPPPTPAWAWAEP